MESWSAIWIVLPRLPELAVIMGGIIYGITQLKASRTASLIGIAGLGLMLVLNLLGTGFAIVMPMLLSSGALDTKTYTFVWSAYSVFSALAWTIALFLLIVAIWKKRPVQNLSEFPPQPNAY